MAWRSGSAMPGLSNMACNLATNSEVWSYCMRIMLWVSWLLLAPASWAMRSARSG